MGLFDWLKKKPADGPAITEADPGDEIRDNVRNCSYDAIIELKLDRKQPASELVQAVNDHIHQWQKDGQKAPDSPLDHEPLIYGSLWGEQLVRTLNWEWVNVTFHEHGDTSALGVVSPDRSLAIYPCHFIFGCMANHAPVTIMLSYNMLIDGSSIPTLPPGGYENVMDGVQHIVPPE